LTRASIFFGKEHFSKKMDHRVKPGDDEPSTLFHGTGQNFLGIRVDSNKFQA